MTDVFAVALASADSVQQARFLNDFACALKVVCKQGHGTGQQLFYIADNLHAEAVAVLRELVDTADYRRREVDETMLEIDARRQELRELQRRIREAEVLLKPEDWPAGESA